MGSNKRQPRSGRHRSHPLAIISSYERPTFELLESRQLLCAACAVTAAQQGRAESPNDYVALDGGGTTYRQDFDQFGTGTEGTPLPLGWSATSGGSTSTKTESAFPVFGTLDIASAGLVEETERALVTGGTAGNSLEFVGKVTGSNVTALQLGFDIETWGVMPLTEPGGEAVFDVTLEADRGDGFEVVTDLGRVSTGPLDHPSLPPTFFPSGPISDTLPATLITSADFNGDGWIDIAAAEERTETEPGRVDIYLNDRQGNFSRSDQLPNFAVPNDLMVGDFNGDEIPDLAIADWDFFIVEVGVEGENDGVHVYYGEGDGTFREGEVLEGGLGPTNLAVDDIDADGFMDIAVANALSNEITLFYGSQSGNFATEPPLETGVLPFDVLIDDLNDDGLKDLASADLLEGTVTVYFSVAGRPFEDVVVFRPGAEGDLLFFVQSADLSGDGHPELIVTYSTDEQDFLQIFRSQGAGRFLALEPVPLGPLSDVFELADFDRDGDLDLAVPAVGIRDTVIYYNKGNAEFESPVIVQSQGEIFTIATGDVDGDGDSDLIMATDAGVELAQNSMQVLDGNAPQNRSVFDSGILSFSLPVDSKLRVQFSVPTGVTSAPYLYGIDNVTLRTLVGGDADGNGSVDFADFLTLSSNFGRTNQPTYADGDFNGSGSVDFADFLILSSNFARSAEPSALASTDSIFATFGDGSTYDQLLRRK